MTTLTIATCHLATLKRQSGIAIPRLLYVHIPNSVPAEPQYTVEICPGGINTGLISAPSISQAKPLDRGSHGALNIQSGGSGEPDGYSSAHTSSNSSSLGGKGPPSTTNGSMSISTGGAGHISGGTSYGFGTNTTQAQLPGPTLSNLISSSYSRNATSTASEGATTSVVHGPLLSINDHVPSSTGYGGHGAGRGPGGGKWAGRLQGSPGACKRKRRRAAMAP